MLEEGNEEILRVATYRDLNESCRLLWIKLWLLLGEDEIITTRPKLAELVNENLYAFLIRYKLLRRSGAIWTSAIYGSGKERGATGIRFQVSHPDKWIK